MRALRTLPYICLLAAAAGCADTTATAPTQELVGTYQLRTVDQAGLPFLVRQQGDSKVTLLEGSITLRDDRTFGDQMRYLITSATAAEPQESVIDGRFVTNVGSLTFLPEVGGSYRVTLRADGTLEQMLGEYRLTYAR